MFRSALEYQIPLWQLVVVIPILIITVKYFVKSNLKLVPIETPPADTQKVDTAEIGSIFVLILSEFILN